LAGTEGYPSPTGSRETEYKADKLSGQKYLLWNIWRDWSGLLIKNWTRLTFCLKINWTPLILSYSMLEFGYLKLYDALETGKFDLDDLAPRIRELKAKQDELSKLKVQAEADMIVAGVQHLDEEIVKSYYHPK
jgi:hypothetical protein